MKIRTIAAVLTGLGLAASTAQAEPASYGRDERYGAARGTTWAVSTLLGTALTAEMVMTSTDTANEEVCIAYDELVRFHSYAGDAWCYWTMTDDLRYGDGGTQVLVAFTHEARAMANDPNVITGGLAEGQVAGFAIPENGIIDSVPRYENLSDRVGKRTGLCSPRTGDESAWQTVRVPCRVDGDCWTGGTCSTSQTVAMQRQWGCAMLRCVADTNNTALSVWVER